MAIFKRGRVYWADFYFRGTRHQFSTRQTDRREAKDIEDTAKAQLLKGEMGLRERKPAPTLGDFIKNRFEPWAKAAFENNSPKTWADWYRPNLKAISEYEPLASRNLDEISSEVAAEFAAHRQSKKLAVSSVNSSLRVLRRILRMAAAWGVITAAPKLNFLRGEKHRDRVITPQEEAKYLFAASNSLASLAIVLADTGMRPEEAYRLCWESITWVNGRHGTLKVTHGKTAAARRLLPMTPRVRGVLEGLWESAGKPEEGWVWPAPTRSGHAEPSTFKKQHAKVFETLAAKAAENNEKPVRPFVLYSLRHTFLTRLGESGCDTWTLARIAGHSSIRMSERYVHPSEGAVISALERLAQANLAHAANEQAAQAPRLKQ